MTDVYVTGAGGQLGLCLQKLAPHFHYLKRTDLDITDASKVNEWAKSLHQPSILNLAAYTKVDLAESEQDQAYAANVEGVKNLAAVAGRFVTISTDFVFDGKKEVPYVESDPTNPLNVYGRTKLQGEDIALKTNPKTIIVRTSWLYSPYQMNFVKRMLELSVERDELTIVSDQFGGPTSCLDLAKVLIKVVASDLEPGIYHYSNAGVASWFELAQETLKLKGSTTPVQPIGTQDYPTPAVRPAYSVMSTEKLQAALGIEIRDWKLALKEVVDLL